MTTDSWDECHQHNFKALFCLTPEADFTDSAKISEAAVAYVNAASPKVLRPLESVQAPMQPSQDVTASPSHGNQGSTDAPLTAMTQLYTIRTTVDVPKLGLSSTTSEVLPLRLRDAFHDSLGRTLPNISSSPELVLDPLPSKPLVVDCSLPASLVPSLAEVLMLSRALATAVAAACQKLGCRQYGYTLLLNQHTVLVKDLSAAQATLRSTTVAPATPSPGPQTGTTRQLRPRPPAKPAVQGPILWSDPVPPAPQPGVFDKDMSCGEERLPVAAVNQVDGSIVGFSEPENILITNHIDESRRAAHKKTLQYITKNNRPVGFPEPPAAVLPAEYDDPHAYLKYLNGNRLPYVESKGFKGKKSAGLTGKKAQGPVYIVPMMQSALYECGPHFGCAQGLHCPYAITQRGCPHRLELRQTKDKGWALHTLDAIPAGGFVTEYTGSIRAAVPDDADANSMASSSSDLQAGHEDEAGGGGTDEFAFDMTPRASHSRDKEAVNELPLLPALHAQVQFVLDAQHTGNAARFSNHSCNPNMFVQPVLSWHHDHSQCNICLFAEDDIPAGAELTFDYGDDYVMAANWRCCCGAKNCVANREPATTLESVTHLSELSLSDNMSPVVPSHNEDPLCVSNHDRTFGGSITSHAPSMRTYSSDSTSPSKKRKTGFPAEQVQLWSDFKEFPELKQALLGQWPPKREQVPTAGPAVIDCTESEAQLSSSTVQGDTVRQEAEQKHKAIKKLLSLSPTTFRLRGPYVEWRRRGSNEGQEQHDQNVIQLYSKLQQLQADSSSDAQVAECWEQHINSLLPC